MTINQKELLRRISRNLKKLRLQHQYTQEELIDKLDNSFWLYTYQRYESKNPTSMKIFNLYQLANFYKVTVDSLFKE